MLNIFHDCMKPQALPFGNLFLFIDSWKVSLLVPHDGPLVKWQLCGFRLSSLKQPAYEFGQ